MVIDARRWHPFIIGKKGFKDVQVLKHLLGAQANAPAARPDLVGGRLFKNAAGDVAPREVNRQGQANRMPAIQPSERACSRLSASASRMSPMVCTNAATSGAAKRNSSRRSSLN